MACRGAEKLVRFVLDRLEVMNQILRDSQPRRPNETRRRFSARRRAKRDCANTNHFTCVETRRLWRLSGRLGGRSVDDPRPRRKNHR